MFFNFDRMMFNIVSVIHWRNPDGIFASQPSPYSFILLRLTGRCVLWTGNTSYLSDVGCVSFVPAGIVYQTKYRGSSAYVIRLSDCTYSQLENLRLRRPEHISRHFEQLLTLWESGCSPNTAKSAVYQLLESIREDSFADADDTFRNCSRYLQAHYANASLKIADVCHQCGISETGLYRQFMAYYGVSPKQYLLKLRLEAAAELLVRDRAPVQEIAWRSGFHSAKHFSRIFREHFGLPPSQYREIR